MKQKITVELELWRAIGVIIFGLLGAWKLSDLILELL